MNDIKLIVKQLILMGKYSISKLNNLIMYIAIMLMAAVTPVIFFPFWMFFSVLIVIGVTFPACLSYISTTYNIRKSTMYKNINMTKNNRYTFYIASFIFFLLVSYLFLTILYSIFLIENYFDILIDSWFTYDHDVRYYLLSVDLLPFIYFIFELSLVMFATMFFFQMIISNEKTMYMIATIFLILGIIYGGGLNSYFGSSTNQFGDKTQNVLVYSKGLFGDKLFYPQLILLPFFSPTQHLETMQFQINHAGEVKYFIWMTDKIRAYDGSRLMTKFEKFNSNILWFMPYIHTAIFGGTAILISKYRKSN